MQDLREYLRTELETLKQLGLYKSERILLSPQQAMIRVQDGREVINLCSNNYLGLANHPEVIEYAKRALDQYGYGLASVRFICGTQDIHKTLEAKLSEFLQTEDTILYSSCFDANGGLFEAILQDEDVIISDSLNHASIIDGVRLCKAHRLRYQNNDMHDLETKLQEAQGYRYRLIVTDGVFSMDGIIANLKDIAELAKQYHALVMVDDSHAVGVIGTTGKGTPEFCNVLGKIDLITGTLGKALGGASGGYISGRREIIEWLRQRSRPYLFSNSVAPMLVATTIHILSMTSLLETRRQQLKENTVFFRRGLEKLGFRLVSGEHPIIPVMLGDAQLALEMADRLLQENIYVIAFSYPVVPKGQARIRTQMSASLTLKQLEKSLMTFEKVGKAMGVI